MVVGISAPRARCFGYFDHRMAGKNRRGNRGALLTASRFPAWAKTLITTLVALPSAGTEAGKRWIIEVLEAVAAHLQGLWNLQPLDPLELDLRRVRLRLESGHPSGDIEDDRRTRPRSPYESEGEDEG